MKRLTLDSFLTERIFITIAVVVLITGAAGLASLLSHFLNVSFIVAFGLLVGGWLVWLGMLAVREWVDRRWPPVKNDAPPDPDDHEDWSSPGPIGPFGRMG